MKNALLPLAFLILSTALTAQQSSEWSRVYTFDDSIIEMNTAHVTFGGRNIARVRFRWTSDQPETLSGEAQVKYKSRLEVIEFNCSDRRYRPYDIILFDATGKVIRSQEMNPPVEWRAVSDRMMEKLFTPACELIERKTHPPVVSNEEIELEKAAKFALSFSQQLEEAKDFNPLIKRFFAPHYLRGYLKDQEDNWFLNLNRETAAKAKRAELERFYVALMNSGYLSCLYFASQFPADPDQPIDENKLPSPDLIQLIKNDPYSLTYKSKGDNFDYLAEKIVSVEQLRSYTDLLEKIAAFMRSKVMNIRAERSSPYQDMLEEWDWTVGLYHPGVRICTRECLGFPKGTRLIEINVPVFHLQLAETKGEFKIVSAMPYFQ